MLAKFHIEVRPHSGAGKTTVVVLSHTREGVADRAIELGWSGDPAEAFATITHVEEISKPITDAQVTAALVGWEGKATRVEAMRAALEAARDAS
jgi:hypothetical protein